MPPTSVNNLDDAALARLLTEEARASSAQYASQSLALRRANGNALKPNTRFLKNLVQDVDSHNATLKRKEDSERAERLRKFEEEERRREREEGRERKRRRTDEEDGRTKRRNHEKKRGRDEHRSRRHRRNTSSASPRSRSPTRQSETSQRRKRSSERRHRRHSPVENQKHTDSKSSKHRKHKRRRSPSSIPPSRSHHKNGSTRHRTPTPSRSPSSTPSSPLTHLLGSLAPPLRRQLGPSHKSSAYHNPSNSAMDARFSAHYDPTTDTQQTGPADDDEEEEGGGGDWDLALEALRDRRSYQKKQGKRMREAGFDEEAIGRWERSGVGEKEKGWEDVRWKGRGEEREWDVGKVDSHEEALAENVGKLKERRKKLVDEQEAWKRKGGGLLKDALG